MGCFGTGPPLLSDMSNPVEILMSDAGRVVVEHSVIRDLELCNPAECSHGLSHRERPYVQPFEIHDGRLAIDGAQGIDRAAVILPLGNAMGTSTPKSLKNLGVVHPLFQLVERKLPHFT